MLCFRLAGVFALGTLICFAPAARAEDRQITELARQVLAELQPESIRRNREYCGLILRTAQNRLVLSRVVRGKRATCRFPNPRKRGEIVATFHTHSAFRKGYDNEVPSVADFDIMAETGLDGYVSTPGGRFWIVEGARDRVRLICGPGCLPSDARYDPDADLDLGEIQTYYTRRSLAERGGDLPHETLMCGDALCKD